MAEPQGLNESKDWLSVAEEGLSEAAACFNGDTVADPETAEEIEAYLDRINAQTIAIRGLLETAESRYAEFGDSAEQPPEERTKLQPNLPKGVRTSNLQDKIIEVLMGVDRVGISALLDDPKIQEESGEYDGATIRSAIEVLNQAAHDVGHGDIIHGEITDDDYLLWLDPKVNPSENTEPPEKPKPKLGFDEFRNALVVDGERFELSKMELAVIEILREGDAYVTAVEIAERIIGDRGYKDVERMKGQFTTSAASVISKFSQYFDVHPDDAEKGSNEKRVRWVA